MSPGEFLNENAFSSTSNQPIHYSPKGESNLLLNKRPPQTFTPRIITNRKNSSKPSGGDIVSCSSGDLSDYLKRSMVQFSPP